MAKIKESSIAEIKDRVNIVDLIGLYVNLHKSGSKYKGLSPFTDEKTPSFFVDSDKAFYYCFSTSQGGDVFKFIQTKEGLKFPEAVEFVANKFSIPIEYEKGHSGYEPSARKQLFDMHEDAATWFNQQFFADTPEGIAMRKYWVQERGFTLDDAKKLRIGYAPLDSIELKRIFYKKKYTPENILASGLFTGFNNEQNIKNFYPRFRGRLIVPICDIQGRTIAFTARKTEFTPKASHEEGKYVNSKETDIFKKNFTVFNLDKAKDAIKANSVCIVVEGQLDAIRMFCSGFENTVATQGTAAGAQHFKLIKRFANKIVLMFDGDKAGRAAILRAIPICFNSELEPFVAVLPDNNDPDSYIKANGIENMKELIDNKKQSAISFAIKTILSDNPNPSPQDKRNAAIILFDIVSHCESKVLQNDYLREISNVLNISSKSVFDDFKEWKDANKNKNILENDKKKLEKNQNQVMLTNSIYDALLVCLHYENVAQCLSKTLDDTWIDSDKIESRALKRLLALYREGIGFNLSEIDSYFDNDDEKNIIYKISTSDKSSIDNPIKYANECIKKIYKNFYLQEINRLNEELESANRLKKDNKFDILRQLSALRKKSLQPPLRIEEE